MKRRRWLKITIYIFVLLLVTELILRFLVGLGDMPVYTEDKDYEYIYAPDQDIWRYGNHFVTNEFGMRSNPVNKKKKITVLEFGDSVLNGGTHVDQDDVATTIEENVLNGKFNNEVQILNISAQSWGPSNAFAFLKKHGDFNAKIIVLVFSSHDYNDNMHFKKVVGNHPAWPDSKPLLAITDLTSRLIWPAVKRWFTGDREYEYLKDFDDAKQNPGWNKFIIYCELKKIPLIVYLHATRSEIKSGKYEKRGLQVLKLCKKHKIKVIKDIHEFSNVAENFTDDIHLNANGHQVMSTLLLPEIIKNLTK